MRAAVYSGTRNVYKDMIPSMKSLLIHSNVEKIYFLIQDDQFPYDLPPEVECINVSNQCYFKQDGPNMTNRCSYMVLWRVVFTKIFPHLDKILTIDNDTIVTENISDLWDIQLDNYYIAGVPQYQKTNTKNIYINMGVALLNLKKIRQDKLDDLLQYNLNHYYYCAAEQDAMNELFKNHILKLPNKYNMSSYSKVNKTADCFIRHYAYTKRAWLNFPLVQLYNNIINYDRNISNNYKLDIIIPYYNDFQGLQVTLHSIYFPQLLNKINITIVDDCSKISYKNDIKNKYPEINYIRLDKNSGSGVARQTGINNTINPYIMFIDTGDYIKNKQTLQQILLTIKKHSGAYLYSYGWENEISHRVWKHDSNCLHGTIFKREFLNLYNIHFNQKEGSYYHQDYGFIHSCYILLNKMQSTERLQYYYFNNKSIYIRTYNPNSMTNTSGNLKTIKGYVYNIEHVINICKQNNISYKHLMPLITQEMLNLYYFYLKCKKENPELIQYNLQYLKYYYDNVYSIIEKINVQYLSSIYNKFIKKFISVTDGHINFNYFINTIKNYDRYNYTNL